MEKKLHKSDTDKKLGGVCAGIAETLDIDISVVRIAAFFLCVFYTVMLIVYFLLAVFLPSKKVAKLPFRPNLKNPIQTKILRKAEILLPFGLLFQPHFVCFWGALSVKNADSPQTLILL